jgi:RimJ/RimL family protein N-acetyltransferase
MTLCTEWLPPDDAGVSLGPFVPSVHLPVLMAVLRQSPWAVDDRYRGMTPAQWEASLAHPTAMAWSGYDGETCGGVLVAEHIDQRSGTCMLHGYGLPMHPGLPGRAGRQAARYLRERLGIATVLATICVRNRGAILAAQRAGFLATGIIPRARLHGGRRYDGVLMVHGGDLPAAGDLLERHKVIMRQVREAWRARERE